MQKSPTVKWLNKFKKYKKLTEEDYNELKKIQLDEEEIREVPEWFDVRNVETFYLQNNKITEFPMFDVKKLRRLELTGNRIKEVPANLDVKKLAYLGLYDNEIKEIPKSVVKSTCDIRFVNRFANCYVPQYSIFNYGI